MGTEAFWVPALASALGGGISAYNTYNASKREDAATAQGIMNQAKIQSEAAGKANALTQQIGADNPQAIKDKEVGDFVNTLRQNVGSKQRGGPTSSLDIVPGANKRYAGDVNAADTSVAGYGTDTANQMGAMDAAVRQRQNESLAMQTLGTGLNTLGAQSATQSFVDQLRARAAGQPNPWVSLGAGLLNAGGRNFTSNPKSALPTGMTQATYNAALNRSEP